MTIGTCALLTCVQVSHGVFAIHYVELGSVEQGGQKLICFSKEGHEMQIARCGKKQAKIYEPI